MPDQILPATPGRDPSVRVLRSRSVAGGEPEHRVQTLSQDGVWYTTRNFGADAEGASRYADALRRATEPRRIS